jgi:hypothetical protein
MESQYAYQRGRSTEAALHNLVQKIEESLNQKEFALGVFLDIYGSFDNASFGLMDAASGEHGVVLTLRRWIYAMLRCRSVRNKISGSSARKSGMPTERSTFPSVVEHSGGWSTS